MRLQRPAWLVGGLALLLSGAGALGQGTFENLGFESATIIPIVNEQIQFGPAFPGWTVYVGGVQRAVASYNFLALDSSILSIIDHSFVNPFGLPGGLIEGNYTAVLQAGVNSAPGGGNLPADTTLSETGLVPAGTESLQFRAHLDVSGFTGSFAVAMGGETLSLVPLQAGANFTVYGADIHTWAGRTAELDFTVIAQRPHIGDNYLYLDSIQFSNEPIPEPGMCTLFNLGALLVGWRALRRQ
jgi:hypothetical protein